MQAFAPAAIRAVSARSDNRVVAILLGLGHFVPLDYANSFTFPASCLKMFLDLHDKFASPTRCRSVWLGHLAEGVHEYLLVPADAFTPLPIVRR